MSRKNPISPEETFPTIEFSNDILEFLPGRQEWLAFVKCLAEDDSEKLRSFSKRVAWTKFLQSQDVNGVWKYCKPQFAKSTRPSKLEHPFPTNPFFVAMFYNAQKCLLLMKDSGVKFSELTEQSFNAYHMLMSAMQFILKSRSINGTSPDVWSLVTLFHHQLFTRDEQALMFDKRCRHGMSPMSWGVYIGQAKYVDYIIYYYSPDWAVQTEAVGINEHLTLDLSHFSGEHPEFFVSPISVLMDIYNRSSLDEVREMGIFRDGFIWRQLVEELYNRSYMMTGIMLLVTTTLCFVTVNFFGIGSSKYLKQICHNSTEGSVTLSPSGLLAILILWIFLSLFSIITNVIGIIRKEIYRHRFGYPKWPRRGYADILPWLAPALLSTPVSLFLFWLHLCPKKGCEMFRDTIYATSGCCTILLLISSILYISCYLQTIWSLTTITTSFYNSLGTFGLFGIVYSILTMVFTRMFQASTAFTEAQIALNNATGDSATSGENFFRDYYTTFLVSLNIVDTSLFRAGPDRIDLSLSHMVFVLSVPILFINFVIGILSAVVNRVTENSIENRYWLMLAIAEFFERTYFLIYVIKKLTIGSTQFKLTVCKPLYPESKLVTFGDYSLDAVMQPSTELQVIDLQSDEPAQQP